MRPSASAREHLSGLSGQVRFVLGDEAAAYGALFAGCRFFGGYPITPASEVAESEEKKSA